MEKPLYSCQTKAVIAEGDQLRCGPKWMMARRGRLRLYGDHLRCGDWTIRYDEIRDAVLTSFRTPILRFPGYVLAIRTETDTYHFGLNGWRFWKRELPFPVIRQKGRLSLSLFSLLVRVVLIVYVANLIWRWATVE